MNFDINEVPPGVENTAQIKAFNRRSENTLAELRRKNACEIAEIKKEIVDSKLCNGLMIGISPKDDVINTMSRGEISKLIYDIFRKARERLSTGALVPVANLSLVLIGEYSPAGHRWHYHGLIHVKDILTLERLKRRISLRVGRCVSGHVMNTEIYLGYMFKQYVEDFNNFYVWNKEECYVRFSRFTNEE